jgi:hypothetical protein
MYDIKDDIKYDIMHDFKCCIPTSEYALGSVLPMQPLAGTSAAGSKLEMVIWRPPRLGLARPRRPTDPDRRCAASWVLVRRWRGTHLLREITSQLGISTGLRVTLQIDKVGIPTEHTQLAFQLDCERRCETLAESTYARTNEFEKNCWLGCALLRIP